ncbi:MAG: flagellar basal body protein, partial [Phenylobacterium sp.]|nr:flagellar basal body protein [Phenylobacterium sp.]
MALSALDAADRVEQLIILTERLTELVALEAQAFEQQRPQEAMVHIEETSRLANIYRHESARVRANPAMVAAAPVAQRTRLIRATEAFDSVLARQGRALDAARTVTEGLVKTIANEVAAQRTTG